MELTQIRYFVEVAKREHVSQAADALNVAQSAVSRQIANLEEELGVALFMREGRNVRLTPIGKIFLEHMEIVLKEIDTAKLRIQELMNPETGTIRLGFPSSMASYMLPTILSSFRKTYPRARFELRQGLIKDLIEAVRDQSLDMAFVTPVPVNKKGLISVHLFDEAMSALIPEGHPLLAETAHAPGESLELPLAQLKDEPLILFRPGMLLRELVDDAFRQITAVPRVAFEGEELETIKGLVAAGLGIAILPDISLIENIPRGARKIPLIDPVMRRSVGILYTSERPLTPPENAFLTFVREFFDRFRQFQA
ncbi:MAG: LysR family transcriptional regulator [Candidatus Carbobacillus altaicus]|uniref:GltC, transcription activator of glutamate synthase operon n=1 Tax=Candidatus Carbonibacillus altaicus TaxID=2163959 RepID=A0A2R6Y0B9_9BACL|nr:LysR family transcriptional regulator [Candidatus Carbobacillus altaicus]PTQ56117.1 MAG: GltC, transcription activator of glutamate synthase operon [Candidatus Carbobacillus altaicus]